jgi:phage terminase small subunit
MPCRACRRDHVSSHLHKKSLASHNHHMENPTTPKSKRGGARPNTGGARPGAGRPPGPVPRVEMDPKDDPLIFLRDVMNDNEADARLRIDAAKALMPYIHQRIGDQGKKEGRQEAAKKAAAGKFKPAAPPKLVVSN